MTRFAAWLAENGLTVWGFIQIHGTPVDRTYEMARPAPRARSRKRAGEGTVSYETLARISDITGIPAGALVEDAMEAQLK